MDWNANLGAALLYTEFDPSDSAPVTFPTATERATIWASRHLYLKGRLLAAGLTISSAGDDKTVAAEMEAYCTSAAVQEANEIQQDGEISDHTKWLKAKCQELIDEYTKDPDILANLGATYDDEETSHPASLQTEFPNPNQDTSDYESPLVEHERDEDF